MKRSFGLAVFAAVALGGCSSSSYSPGPVPSLPPAPVVPVSQTSTAVNDLRFGQAPEPATAPGFDPAGDAKALIAAGTASPAQTAISGTQIVGSLGTNEQFVMRVPTAWNGKLVVAGTPATRSAFANDAIWSDYVLAKGYAFASSNKGISYNAVVDPITALQAPSATYPIPFDVGKFESSGLTLRLGLLAQGRTSISDWNNDFAQLTRAAKTLLRTSFGHAPTRTYAVGLSNGGAQVRSLLEQHPDLVDGGVDWSGVYWSTSLNILTYMPKFIAAMQTYTSSGFTDPASAAAIQALGYPPDRKNGNTGHPSLWSDYYSNAFPFYTDLTVFEYALFLDPTTVSSAAPPPCTPNPVNPVQLPGTCNATGLALPANRAAYQPSAAASSNIATFAHTGAIAKPLTSIAGNADMFITVSNNATPYLNAVNAAGKGTLYHQYIVDGGTHVDTFSAFGYGLQPQLPFAWRAFDQIVDIVENNASVPGAGTAQTVGTPATIPVP